AATSRTVKVPEGGGAGTRACVSPRALAMQRPCDVIACRFNHLIRIVGNDFPRTASRKIAIGRFKPAGNPIRGIALHDLQDCGDRRKRLPPLIKLVASEKTTAAMLDGEDLAAFNPATYCGVLVSGASVVSHPHFIAR